MLIQLQQQNLNSQRNAKVQQQTTLGNYNIIATSSLERDDKKDDPFFYETKQPSKLE